MISADRLNIRLEQLRGEAVERGRYSFEMSVGLSVILSLAAVAIISKSHLTNYLWVNVTAFVVPLPIALYFKNRIGRLGTIPYISALMLALGAAVLFGI